MEDDMITSAKPPSGTTRHAFLKAYWPWGVYLAGLAIIVGYAATLRFSIPQAPIIDPDYWGYLNPGVSKLTGGPFKHTFGRNFVYPGFLFLVLRAFGDYRSVCVSQHVLGLLTGVALAGAWNLLCGFLAGPAWGRMAARFIGLLLAADFLLSYSPLLFEHTVRPEAVFPFFLASSFVLNLAALHARYAIRRPNLERWCLALNFFAVALAQSLKPSLGFGIVAANLPLALFLVRWREPWIPKIVVAGAAVTFTALTLWLPERLLASTDPGAATFLPETLFVVHAKIIHTQIVDDLRTGDTAPYTAEWLGNFNRQLEEALETASHPDQSPYRTLGFNPDYLQYVQPVFQPSFRQRQSDEIAAFCMHFYERAWLRQRPAMLAKVEQQLEEVYNFTLKLGTKHRLLHLLALPHSNRGQSLAVSYQNSWKCCQEPRRIALMLSTSGGAAYLDSLQALATTSAVIREPDWVNLVNSFLARWHLPLLGLTLLTGTLLAALSWRTNLPLVGSVWLFWAINFAMFLTVAIVHSLEPRRYTENQRVCTVFGEFAAVLLVWQGVALLLGRIRRHAQRTGPDEKAGNPALG